MFKRRTKLLKTTMFLLVACVLTYTLVMLISMDGFQRPTMFHIFYGNDDSAPSSESVNHIFFLKTHKTGSSTMANILYRYGDKRNLNFVMPLTRVWFDWPQRFHLFNTRPLYGQEANILCCHTRYNKGPVNLLFPKERAKYITILRSPAKHFDSAFHWFKLYQQLGLSNESNPLRAFLRAPTTFTNLSFIQQLNPEIHREIHLLRNPALFELGLDYKHFQNLSAIKSFIEYIDKEFDLVMINDYYDESLILLKELLCWDFQDILYIKQKVRGKKTPLSEEVRANLLSWNQPDALLFYHFNKTFWRKVSNMGPKFYKDLKRFREQNEKIGKTCLKETQNGDLSTSMQIPRKYRQLCKQMTTHERVYIEYMKMKMDKKWADVDESLPREDFFAPENSWYSGHDLLYKPVRTTP